MQTVLSRAFDRARRRARGARGGPGRATHIVADIEDSEFGAIHSTFAHATTWHTSRSCRVLGPASSRGEEAEKAAALGSAGGRRARGGLGL